ncbi:MAG TPA: DNA gyrase subunit A [Longimicrobiales bacterium]|nr:DNA gyrase subunit A [Longimicrobiales bacterium]
MPTRRERVLPRLIEEEMRSSFLDYSMSVIVQRALPDVRDGLKPVHRRILHAMNEAGLSAGRPYKKSATVVGDVLGKYHPHGDMAVYEAMVRMVQDFSLRYPLVDGQGNFGSIDGDNAAAYRYTEARLAAIAMDLLADIDRDTVDFAPNFDDRLKEPTVLPARFPNLLVNGSSGIAVGMATNIPPHNLEEVAGALKALITDPDVTVEELMEHMPGPDFPTGAFILGSDGIRDAYTKGRGRIVMRAAVQKETRRGGREQLVVTALPYGVSKAKVIEQIASVARGGKVEDIADLRDESDRDGMRIVIELKRGAKTKPILATLYKQTYLQATFGAIMLALDHGVPRELTLKEMLERFRDHRVEVIQRRARYDLEKARAEAHIIQGLLIALEYIDEVIAIIRASTDQDEAARALCNSFDLSEEQARAILAMRLGRLTALETDDLKKQLSELKKLIRRLEEILASEARQLEVLIEELDDVVGRFADARRTQIIENVAEYEVEDLVAEEQVVITLSHESYIKRVPLDLYRRRMSRGRAVAGMDRHEEDFLEHVFVAGTQDTLVFFTQSGQAHALAVADVPEAGPSSRGRALAQLMTIQRGDRVAALIPVQEFSEDRLLLFLTSGGIVKRTTLDQYSNIRSGGIAAIRVQEGDRLLDVQVSEGANDIVLVTGQGRAIRFAENDVPSMGRVSQGVKGIQLRKDDGVVGMAVIRREATLCTVTENGYAKRTPMSEYPAQKRGGLGTITLDVSSKTGPLIAAKELLDGDELMVITAAGAAFRVGGSEVPVQGRATQGKRVISVGAGDRVVEVSRVAREGADTAGARRGTTDDGTQPDDDANAGDSDGEDQLDLMS